MSSSILTIASLFFAFTPVSAQANVSSIFEQACLKRSVNSALARKIAKEQYLKTNKFNIVDAKLIKSPDDLGDRYLIKKASDQPWNSTYGLETDNPMGDPRVVIAILGAPTAKKLGFEIISEDEIIVPSAKYLNNAIDEMNGWLLKNGRADDVIPSSFFPVRGKISDEVYVRGVAKKQIPVSDPGEFTDFSKLTPEELENIALHAHDMSSHIAQILIHKDIIKQAGAQNKVLAEFVDAYRKVHPKTQESEAFIFQLFKERGRMNDQGTAFFADSKLKEKITKQSTQAAKSKAYDHAFGDFASDGDTPLNSLSKLMLNVKNKGYNDRGISDFYVQFYKNKISEKDLPDLDLSLKKFNEDVTRKRRLLLIHSRDNSPVSVRGIGQKSGQQIVQDLKKDTRRITYKKLELELTPIEKNADDGGAIRVLNKSADTAWRSYYGFERTNPMGDIRNIFLTVGPEIAEFLGFKIISDVEIIIPSVKRLNSRIKILNNHMRKTNPQAEIDLLFYATEEKASQLQYMVNYVEKGALPISQEDLITQIHDYSYHVASLLLPYQTVLQSRAQTKFHLKFVDALIEQDVQTYNALMKNGILDQWNEVQVARIDIGTGDFSNHFALDDNAIDFGFSRLTGEGKSPQELLRKTIDQTKWDDPKLKEKVEQIFKRFDEAQKQDKDYTRNIKSFKNDFLNAIREKREELEKAIAELKD